MGFICLLVRCIYLCAAILQYYVQNVVTEEPKYLLYMLLFIRQHIALPSIKLNKNFKISSPVFQ